MSKKVQVQIDDLQGPPLIERRDSLATLNDNLQMARDGEPRFVLISGEQGIGKSALIDEFCSSLDGRKIPVFRVDCADGAEDMFAPVLQLIQSLYRKHGKISDDDAASPPGGVPEIAETNRRLWSARTRSDVDSAV